MPHGGGKLLGRPNLVQEQVEKKIPRDVWVDDTENVCVTIPTVECTDNPTGEG